MKIIKYTKTHETNKARTNCQTIFPDTSIDPLSCKMILLEKKFLIHLNLNFKKANCDFYITSNNQH